MSAVSTAQRRKSAPARQASVLYDAPGPIARRRNVVLTVVFSLILLGVAYFVVVNMGEKGQLAPEKWKPFTDPSTWTTFILPGMVNTLSAAGVAAVLALVFGAVFGIARLSDHAWIRLPAGAVVEFFRAVPLLHLMFFAQYGASAVLGITVLSFQAVVFGLVLYNGSVLAEIVRAGIRSVPRGQSEAAFGIGLRKSQVMRMILLPQAVTAMMPAIVSQLVVLLKDTALGTIIAYPELVTSGVRELDANFGNLIPAAIVVAILFIIINMALSYLATWFEKRSRRSRKSSAATLGPALAPPAPGMQEQQMTDRTEK
ncbi:amino acid ABC transporter permease [Bailinhaonella thermotolerans]|uniref:Amino acid ABC transporter permease n=1 Tax=Bailinhaonella thermotolerans TaxID=1070861 RepID=A0A3A4AE10_9ACTN|nr:amino acid ABC transporter permease [Bailinhaonella thermotolerans]RJL26529.1 amino acid ABC transporter permease [Bailinhaonella thermotolerans]